MQASVKEDREKWIGGSDIPIIMGISPFTTRYDLLLYKAKLQENEFNGNEYTEYGNIMESKIRDYVNELFNTNFIEGKHEDEKLGYRCHTDGENKDTILEIKTTSQIHDSIEDYKIYLVQLLFYMMNTHKEKGVLAVYERPEDFNEEFDETRLKKYEIDIKDYQELCNDIMVAVNQFKMDLDRIKENPLLTEEDLLPIPIKELSHELEVIENKLETYKQLEQEEKELKQKLYEAMEKYNIKKWETPDKKMLITRVESTPDKTVMKFNEDKFKEELPIVYASYTEETIQKGRTGGIRITIRNNE
jgi:putative phage-type endonuclease